MSKHGVLGRLHASTSSLGSTAQVSKPVPVAPAVSVPSLAHEKRTQSDQAHAVLQRASPVPLFTTQPAWTPTPMPMLAYRPPEKSVQPHSTRRATLERTITANAAPDAQNRHQLLPKELHNMVDELLTYSWDHLGTTEAIGSYLDALCRRERICGRSIEHQQRQLKRQDDAIAAFFPRVEMNVISTNLLDESKAEREYVLQRAMHVFRIAQGKWSSRIANRYMGSYLETMARQGDVKLSEEIVEYVRQWSEVPYTFYAHLACAYAQQGDLAGTERVRDRLLKEVKGLPPDHPASGTNKVYYVHKDIGLEHKMDTLAELCACVDVYIMRAALMAGNVKLAEDIFAALRASQAGSNNVVNVVQYVAGCIGHSPSRAVEVIGELRADPQWGPICTSLEFHRIILTIMLERQMIDHLQDSVALHKLYLNMLEDASKFDFAFHLADLNWAVLKLIRAGLYSSRAEPTLSAYDLAMQSSKAQSEGRLLGAETVALPKSTYRLTYGVLLSVCRALALYGEHESAISLFLDALEHYKRHSESAADHPAVGALSALRMRMAGAVALGHSVTFSRPSVKEMATVHAALDTIQQCMPSKWFGVRLEQVAKDLDSLQADYPELLAHTRAMITGKLASPFVRQMTRSRYVKSPRKLELFENKSVEETEGLREQAVKRTDKLNIRRHLNRSHKRMVALAEQLALDAKSSGEIAHVSMAVQGQIPEPMGKAASQRPLQPPDAAVLSEAPQFDAIVGALRKDHQALLDEIELLKCHIKERDELIQLLRESQQAALKLLSRE